MKSLLASLLCILALVACDKAPAPAAPPSPGPSAKEAPAPAEGSVLSGTVGETIAAAGYTYVRVRTAQGDAWAAVPQTTLQKGAPVRIAVQMVSAQFHSKTLGRTFAHLTFGTLAGAGEAQAPAAPQPGTPAPLPPGHPATDGLAAQRMSGGPATLGTEKVAKASGKDAKTVSELWAGRSALAGKTVAVRGTVVKFLPEILGKNWVHLRDGSGAAGTKDNDLTVTTQEVAKVGEVVTATGTVHTDKDYGAGYAYPVILEEAKLSR
jgi:hypothetical protein